MPSAHVCFIYCHSATLVHIYNSFHKTRILLKFLENHICNHAIFVADEGNEISLCVQVQFKYDVIMLWSSCIAQVVLQ